MDATEPWTAIGAVIAGVLIATFTYFKTNGRKQTDPHEATAGLFIDRETMRRISENLERIADAAELLADKKQDHMSETIDKILQQMEKEEARKPTRRPP
ncbi:hypothetical protein [Rhizobium sp. EC-SD404]|uniref:hypothetical protein n=1 Tax=Rhizobium sp. EC-SD404 TaxID=2038389 RepID=UPI00125AA456|nr:hypothetical protein [Rhizobium sp. EC-SD404]VVT32941.1 conserved hypothetical protein [Rhizobium sp. EC-SD404]